MSEATSIGAGLDSTLERYDAEKYQGTFSLNPQYVHDHGQMKERVKDPEKRITWVRDEGIYSIHSVDSVGQVKTVSDVYHNHRSSLWQNEQKKHESISKTLLGVSGVVGTVCVVSFVIAPQIRIIASLAFIMFSSLNIFPFLDARRKAKDAEHQVKLWSTRPTLAQDVADLRAKAYEKGFAHVFSQDLKKEGILQPKEIAGLYREYFSEFVQKLSICEEHHEKGAFKWMQEFSAKNPLLASMMKYGLGEIPENLKSLSDAYEKYQASLQSIHAFYNNKKDEIQLKSTQRIGSLEGERSQQLAMCRQNLEMEIAKSKAKLDQFIQRHHPLPCKECHKADQIFKNEKKRLGDAYDASVAALNHYLDQKIQSIHATKGKRLKGLSDNEIHQIMTKTTELFQVYEDEKIQKLKMAQQALEAGMAEAKAKLEGVTQIHLQQPCAECNQAEESFQQEKKRHENFYAESIISINDTFDGRLGEVRDFVKQNLKGLSWEAIDQAQKTTDEFIRSLEEERTRAIEQLLKDFKAGVAQAEADRDEVFKLHPDTTSPEHQIGEENFQRARKHQEETYAKKVVSINNEFNGRASKAREVGEGQLEGLSTEEIARVRLEENRRLQALDEEKAEMLKQNLDFMRAQVSKVQAKKDEVFKLHPHQATCLDCQKAMQNYMVEKQHYEESYDKQAASIHAEYNHKFNAVLDVEKRRLKGLTREDIQIIQQKAKEQIQSIEAERTQTLKPYREKQQTEMARAEAQRDRVIGAHPHWADCPDCQKAEETYRVEKHQHQVAHSNQVASIHTHFNGQILDVKTEQKENLQKIVGEENDEVLKYFPVGREILLRAQSWKI